MADLSKEQQQEIECLAEPAGPCEREMLGKNEERGKAAEEVASTPVKEEEKLPKLSAADFRAYNSMAEHMEYFVRICMPAIWALG
jgi:hypothetical protein